MYCPILLNATSRPQYCILFMDEHDYRRRGEVDSRLAEMGQHGNITYAIVLQTKNTDVIGRIRDRLTHMGHESPSLLAWCVGRKVKRHISLADEK